MRPILLALVALCLWPDVGSAQLLRRGNCPGGVCPMPRVMEHMPFAGPPIIMQPPAEETEFQEGQEVSAEQWYRALVGPGRNPTAEEKALAELVRFRAVRVKHQNSCGTGNLVGRDAQYIYILTNAHVASTRIGSTSSCEAVVNGRIEKFTCTAIESAYSNTYRTDWTLLRAPASNMAGIAPIQLSTEMPDPNALTVTWGCPRCEPIKGQACKTVRFGTVWYWQPNSIGGQSGSAVIQMEDGVPVQKGLLTWTESGNGSGQFSATIYEQSQNRTERGEMRTGDEVPVELSEGYHRQDENPHGVELMEGWGCVGDEREVSLRDYPIWHVAGSTPPVDPPQDPPCCPPSDCPWEGWSVLFQNESHALLQKDVPVNQSFWLEFVLYAWANKDAIAEKIQDILEFVQWVEDFVAGAGETEDRDMAQAEAELGQMLEDTGFPMPAARGDFLKGLLKYMLENPDAIKQWVDLIKALFA